MTKIQRRATTIVLEMNETPILALAKRTTTGVSIRQRVEKSKTDSANPKGEFVGLEGVSEANSVSHRRSSQDVNRHVKLKERARQTNWIER